MLTALRRGSRDHLDETRSGTVALTGRSR